MSMENSTITGLGLIMLIVVAEACCSEAIDWTHTDLEMQFYIRTQSFSLVFNFCAE